MVRPSNGHVVAEPDQKPAEPQPLSYELQQDLRRVVELLRSGYKAWLAEQTADKK
jgi:hypothetical protein